MAKQKFLNVVCNPFCVLDHQGRPSAIVHSDPDFHDPSNKPIGAVRKSEMLKPSVPVDLTKGQTNAEYAKHDIWFECTPEVVKIPVPVINGVSSVHMLSHYLREMRPSAGGQAALLPADQATAKMAGVYYADPSRIIVDTAMVQATRWAADHDGELPEWAEATEEHLAAAKVKLNSNGHLESYEGLHPSHAAHARFLAAHKAKLSAPAAKAAPPPMPAPLPAPTPTKPVADGGKS